MRLAVKKLSKVLALADVDLGASNRIRQCTEVLKRGNHVNDYPELWRDISKRLIEPARQYRAQAMQVVLRRLKVSTVTEAVRLSAERLSIKPRSALQEIAIRELRDRARPGWKKAYLQRMRNKQAAECNVAKIYRGSDSALTKRLHNRLKVLGPDGELAAILLQVQKPSDRAKQYKSGYRELAYDKKGEALAKLCEHLQSVIYVWGWGKDRNSDCEWVLYLELPTGQVSWHSPVRGNGPDYLRAWDGVHGASKDRVIIFAQSVLGPITCKKCEDVACPQSACLFDADYFCSEDCRDLQRDT